jgi:hypothetical protein
VLALFFVVRVLLFFFVEVGAGFAVLIDQAELELVKMFGAELKFAGGVLAALYFAMKCFSLLGFLVAHGVSPLHFMAIWGYSLATLDLSGIQPLSLVILSGK